MSVILVNPPSLYRTPSFGLSYFELSRRQLGANGVWSLPGEHLGLRSIEASCMVRDIPVEVINGQVLFHRSIAETWAAIRGTAQRNGEPYLVGFTGPCQVFSENLELAAHAKQAWPGCTTVLGHDFATLNYPRILREHPEFDLVILGEGEVAFPALAEALAEGRNPAAAGIPGVAARHTALTSRPALDIDTLPWPSRGDLGAVLAAGLSAAVFTSRGCPYRCTYCTTGEVSAGIAARDRQRLKSLNNVVAEIEYLVTGHGVRFVNITDDLFLTKSPASRERAQDLARRLISAKLDLSFMCDSRIDSIDRETYGLLREAGLRRVFIGIETSNPQQLEFYNKRYTRSANRRSYIRSQLAIVEDLGIEVIPGIITYHAESSVAELRDALELIDECDLDSAFLFLNRLIAYPGTQVYHHYKQRGLLVQDWPLPRWEFANVRVAEIESEMRRAVTRGCTFRELRDIFASLVSHEETVESNASP